MPSDQIKSFAVVASLIVALAGVAALIYSSDSAVEDRMVIDLSSGYTTDRLSMLKKYLGVIGCCYVIIGTNKKALQCRSFSEII